MKQNNWTPDRPYCIYKHTCPSGNIYIGQTCKENLNDRWSNGNGYKGCHAFYNAIQRYGWDNITHDIIEENLTKAEADAREIYYIGLAKKLGISYNIREGGADMTENDRLRVSQKLKGKMIGPMNPMYKTVSPNRGLIMIHKDSESVFISEKQLDEYIASGWVIGLPYERRKKMSNIFFNRIWIKKNGHTKLIPADELEKYISNGWVRGRIVNDGWSRPVNQKTKQLISKANSGGVYIHKDGICKHVAADELEKYISNGWIRGQLKPSRLSFSKKMVGRIFVNNGATQKMVSRDDVQFYLQQGWVRGRLN